MVTILDYIRWTVHQPFSIQAAGTVDSLVFCYLSYLDLRSILPEGGALSVAACCHAALETNAALKTVDGGPGHEEVLRALISSRRFAPVLITDYTDLLDEQAQFSAEVFLLPEGLPGEAAGRPGMAMAVKPGGLAKQLITLLPGEGNDRQPQDADLISGGASVE